MNDFVFGKCWQQYVISRRSAVPTDANGQKKCSHRHDASTAIINLKNTNNHCCSFQYYYILENALHSAQSNEVMLKTSVNYKLMNYGCNL